MKKRKGISHEISPNFDIENYACKKCDCKIEESCVKCPECDGEIVEYVNYDNWNYCLLRKYVSEIEVNDTILMRSNMKGYQVLDVSEWEDNIYKVALKGHGVIKLEADDFVKCIWGTWEKGTTPWQR